MTTFSGFERGTRLLPVPAPVLGSLLAEIEDMAELKCTLRFFWYAAQAKGSPKFIPAVTLETDEVLLAALGGPDEVRKGLGLAVERGTLLAANGALLLNTPENARAAAQIAATDGATAGVRSAPDGGRNGDRAKPNVYSLYEANIGLLTPMVADQLRDAEEQYPEEWIEAAFREAVEQNKRSWRYIAAILERWTNEGRGEKRPSRGQGTRGESGRHPETVTAAEYLRRRKPSR
ncbi:MAG: DnaD domain protein [Dehalococcoidia bacterium]